MLLLDFPPELLQLILYHSSTPGYLQAAISCRTLFLVASSCRAVILHHLYQTPGLNAKLESLTTRQLFDLLRKRAVSHLYGVNFHLDQTVFAFRGRSIDSKASTMRLIGNPSIALVLKGDPNVYLYHQASGSISLHQALVAPHEHVGKLEVIKVIFSQSDTVSVLQRFTPLMETEMVENDPQIWGDSMDLVTKTHTYLVHYQRSSPGEKFSSITFCEFPDYEDYNPLAIDVARKSLVAISWQHPQFRERRYVVVHTESPDETYEKSEITYLRYTSTTVLDKHGLGPAAFNPLPHIPHRELSPVIDIAFSDFESQLLYYHPASAIYGHFQNLRRVLGKYCVTPLMLNSCVVPFQGVPNLEFSIAIPFFSTHNSYYLNPTHRICHWKYLALGTATSKEENWTIACLLRSEARCRYSRCQHVENLDRGRRFDRWTVVARLWGYRPTENSLCGNVATSRGGTRVAIANWKSIYIWALAPQEIIEENCRGFYPPNMRSNHGVVELKPIVLQPDAVCFTLDFTDKENELIALTDRGMMRWDLSPTGKGVRTNVVLKAPNEVGDGELKTPELEVSLKMGEQPGAVSFIENWIGRVCCGSRYHPDSREC